MLVNLETSLVTSNRRDLAVSPFAPTVLDKLNKAGIDTYALVRSAIFSTGWYQPRYGTQQIK